MNQKIIVFDAGTLISFSMNGILDYLRGLKKIFKGKFIITKEVHKEIIDNPISIKRFELEALKLKQLVNEGILELPSSIGFKNIEISKKAEEIMNLANNTFISPHRPVHLIDLGESSAIALILMLKQKDIESVFAVDERTTRSIIETPGELKKYLEKKLHVKLKVNMDNFKELSNIKVIRSTELIYVAYKKGLVDIKIGNPLDALLYAVKFKGCAISSEEISQIEKMG